VTCRLALCDIDVSMAGQNSKGCFSLHSSLTYILSKKYIYHTMRYTAPHIVCYLFSYFFFYVCLWMFSFGINVTGLDNDHILNQR